MNTSPVVIPTFLLLLPCFRKLCPFFSPWGNTGVRQASILRFVLSRPDNMIQPLVRRSGPSSIRKTCLTASYVFSSLHFFLISNFVRRDFKALRYSEVSLLTKRFGCNGYIKRLVALVAPVCVVWCLVGVSKILWFPLWQLLINRVHDCQVPKIAPPK